ncbi:YkgJ family cysteine cluster protein [Clostridium sp. MSJ-8]|uniref:YkgJ family cysteine cluster protein n=1 Tax=Clostridium sp. MSJ-8 TaxID=2841510 RepID=UPI001C0E9E1C|nr:YkgJ family cysteine cluster protein [Clostridium sp. MSJ-8]MBU5488793.1 YkgJ family cysteine cluster protein [Clostridium sp. MSJ-8]
MFKCDCCGLCCMNVGTSELYSDLDRGDGICRYFNDSTRLCSIYQNRPDRCNVDRMYELVFSKSMSKDEYYELNYEACEKLKRREK